MTRLLRRLPFKVLREREGGDVYLIRYRLAAAFGFSVLLHRILREDSTQDYHDHPWPFLQVILWGGYLEEVRSGFIRPGHREGVPLRPGTVRLRPAAFGHRVGRLLASESWSLVITGRHCRDWGFIRWQSGEWVQWKKYIEEVRGGDVNATTEMEWEYNRP